VCLCTCPLAHTHTLKRQRKLQPKQAAEDRPRLWGAKRESLRRPESNRAADGSAPQTRCCPKRTALRHAPQRNARQV
jgi:hypothetical protein